MSTVIRPYRPENSEELDALYAICLRTGDHGADASARYADPRLLGEVYAGPYAALEPELVFVAEDGEGVCGYVLGTGDSEAFAARCERLWWPPLRRRYPLPDPEDDSDSAHVVRRIHAGAPLELPFLGSHPAHLHIDLLPRGQGHGLGRRLMERFVAALRERGVPGLHLGVSALNPRAIAFYRRFGFETLQAHPWGEWMGLRLTPPQPAAVSSAG
ncbi:GNAT family N-acetyltransferase [Aquabacterium sp. A7-Y]|uniref:GNAT family N-acetyltransferase n=1 Tax=Aquabacterium sp. A7-Y TaxID=1349605 RepID=UPI00223DBB75|nr:GNAT family N-acetyltransferase [Aquabacterium sp. A7-Y]MCW7538488.1 GNAT family N-acetyltransferase [Aquabacterium sp. A7-Y]